jgi:hypothetical protein
MKPYWYAAAVIAATCTLAACGGSSEQERAAEELKKSSEEMQKGADSMSKGAEDMARGFEAMAKGLAGAAGSADIKPVDPVSFRELQTVMPDVAGWEKANPTGERMSSPFSFSQASVTYRKGDAEIEQKIMDSGFNQLLFTPFTMFMAAGYEKETQDGFERSVNVAGYPGWEKWDKDSKNGELNVVVNKRFLVQLEGHGVDDIQTLHTVLERTDLKKLAALN